LIIFLTAGAGITAHTEWVHGFVEELVVEDDPEYQWLDKIRTPRATNEARQTIFLKLSNEVQRRIGLKVLELGANAVIGLVILFCTIVKSYNEYSKMPASLSIK
jgi:hypothetical protein